MDQITNTYTENTCKYLGVKPKEDISVKFEHFVNYVVFLTNCPGAYETHRDSYSMVHTGLGGDWGIDGILILINDQPIFSVEEARDIIGSRKKFDAKFIFTQAKTSSTFDSGEMLKTKEGVKRFFKPNTAPENRKLRNAYNIKNEIFRQSIKLSSNPECEIYFATTGNWVEEPELVNLAFTAEKELYDTNLFDSVSYRCLDAKRLQKMYKRMNSSAQVQVKFERSVTFPAIPGTSQAFVGFISSEEFIKVISDDGKLDKSLFYENVRAFLGENSVNKEITSTLNSASDKTLFPILNNGVTIVARSLNKVGDDLTINDYQIVNGCQTSYILFQNRHSISGIMIPVKVIASENQDVINKIIRSTNRQTAVTLEAFESIKEIHKTIQDFYNTFTQPDRIYYERRLREYDRVNADEIPRYRVFNIPQQVNCHVAMFLDEPHRINNEYYASLMKSHRHEIFQDSDNPIVYYTSCRAYYRIEDLLHSLPKDMKKIGNKYKNYLLMIFRHLIEGKRDRKLNLNSHKMVAICQKILSIIDDDVKFRKILDLSLDVIIKAERALKCRGEGTDPKKMTHSIITVLDTEYSAPMSL